MEEIYKKIDTQNYHLAAKATETECWFKVPGVIHFNREKPLAYKAIHKKDTLILNKVLDENEKAFEITVGSAAGSFFICSSKFIEEYDDKNSYSLSIDSKLQDDLLGQKVYFSNDIRITVGIVTRISKDMNGKEYLTIKYRADSGGIGTWEIHKTSGLYKRTRKELYEEMEADYISNELYFEESLINDVKAKL
ncbi:hypothetical protein [Poseidonibacter lekithochrous]|uniref:hypothetical protein n=1 Tax=Poseidonibacter lekithochrous TaxID=1904463 RepID=UPI000D3AF6D7|nr:hypothetical protein [Poseidonibacter lekithochrous]